MPDVAGEPTLAGAIDLVMGSAGAQGGANGITQIRSVRPGGYTYGP